MVEVMLLEPIGIKYQDLPLNINQHKKDGIIASIELIR